MRCSFLGPCSLAALSCTCRAFRQLSSSPQGQLSLWQSLCRRRWLALNAHLFPSQTAGGTDFKRIYGEGNAWVQKKEAYGTLSPSQTSTEVASGLSAPMAHVAVLHSSVDPASLGFGALNEGTTILTTLWGDLRTVSLPAGGQPTVLAASLPLDADLADLPFMNVQSLAESGGPTPLAAVGPKHGATQIHRLQQSEPGTLGHWQPVWSIACPPRWVSAGAASPVDAAAGHSRLPKQTSTALYPGCPCGLGSTEHLPSLVVRPGCRCGCPAYCEHSVSAAKLHPSSVVSTLPLVGLKLAASLLPALYNCNSWLAERFRGSPIF